MMIVTIVVVTIKLLIIHKNSNGNLNIIMKYQKKKINKNVQCVYFHVIPYIHFPVRVFFRTYQWRPKSYFHVQI